jgi:hypothetical protein
VVRLAAMNTKTSVPYIDVIFKTKDKKDNIVTATTASQSFRALKIPYWQEIYSDSFPLVG